MNNSSQVFVVILMLYLKFSCLLHPKKNEVKKLPFFLNTVDLVVVFKDIF